MRRLEANDGVVHPEMSDDAALDLRVIFIGAEPEATRWLRYGPELIGQIMLASVTIHAARDPTAFNSLGERSREIVEVAGNCDLLG